MGYGDGAFMAWMGWGIYGLNGWGIYGLNGWGIYDLKWVMWGSYGEVSYCSLGDMLSF